MVSCWKKSNIFPTKDEPLLGTVYGSQRNGLDLADLRSVETSHLRLGGKYRVGNILYERNNGFRISSDGSGARKIYNDLDAGDDVDPARFLEKPEAREVSGNMFSSSRFISSRSSVPHTSDSGDIKKRMGPVHQRLHVSQRLMKKKKSSLKKQLAPAPSKKHATLHHRRRRRTIPLVARSAARITGCHRPSTNTPPLSGFVTGRLNDCLNGGVKHATLPWLKNRISKKVPSTQDDSNGNHHDQGGEQLGLYFPFAVEPAEKSEYFKQLVHSAFFKFLKQINETPGKRKKFVEPGKDGSLKCIVCSSDSNEFVDTEKMAMHAFASKEVGLRSQHMGFCKALDLCADGMEDCGGDQQ